MRRNADRGGRRRARGLVVAGTGLLALVLAGAAPAQAPVAERGRAAVGTPAPAWELHAPDGTRHRLADLEGRVVFMDFWASWCEPCIEAKPAVASLHRRYADRGAAFFSVHCRDEADPRQSFAEGGYEWPLLLEGDVVADRYAVPTLPAFIIIDAAGSIAYRGYGYGPGAEEKLAAAIEQAIAATGSGPAAGGGGTAGSDGG